MSGMTRRSSTKIINEMNTTKGGESTIEIGEDGEVKPKRREKKIVLPPYKNKTAPFEFIRLLHRTKEMKEYSDQSLSVLWDKILIHEFQDEINAMDDSDEEEDI